MAAYSVKHVLHHVVLPPAENIRLKQKDLLFPADKLTSMIDLTVIGRKTKFNGPFGERQVVYCDYSASGRSSSLIEHYIMEQVLPLYSNIRTNTTVNSKQTMLYGQEARDIIRNAVNASQWDAVIFVGSESVAPVQKLIQSLKLQTSPVVFVGPFQPDSNLIPWKDIGSEIVEIQENAQGLVDMECLETNLQKWQETGRRLIGYFLAASNVTGVISDDIAITVMLHRYGARAFWDFTSAGPHIKINMNPADTEGNRQVSAFKDAVFLSPSMLIGGVESPGVLVAKKSLFENVVPNNGRPDYINHWDHRYSNDIEMREEGGFQSVVGAVRAGLAFQLKEAVGTDYIVAREREVCKRVLSSWSKCPNLVLLGNTAVPRLPIFSFLIRNPSTKQFLHHNFVCAVLNDVFGIQASEACACAGRYVQDLLGIDEKMAQKIKASLLEDRPGFTCIGLPYFMDHKCVDFVIQAVCMMATHAWKLLPQYVFNAETGEWTQRDQVFMDQRSLTSIRYSDGKMTYKNPARNQAIKHTFEDLLKFAQNIFEAAEKTPLPDQSILFDLKTSALHWFMRPSEALTLLKKSQPCYIEERRYACSHCDKTFTQKSALNSHKIRIHIGYKPFACSHCGKAFETSGCVKRHMSIHTGDEQPNKHVCSYCDKAFKTSGGLNSHMRIHTGERPYECGLCNKTFIESGALKTHIRIHTGERPHECSYCNKTFIKKSALKVHIRIHTGERPHKCSHCNKAFMQLGALKAHIRIHTGERPYECSYCNKAFIKLSALQSHILIHTGERPCACRYCDKAFKTNSDLNRHLKFHTGGRPHECSHCNKAFVKLSSLKAHVLIHTGERPCACCYCDKAFKTNSDLNRHLKIHTGERPYECSYCDKKFIDSGTMKTHVRTHTGERRYVCGQCDKACKNRRHLKAHIRIHI